MNSDYVEYMMGHIISTYHDIQALGLEKLRTAYASAALSIGPRTPTSKIDMVKEFARGLGLNPEEILVKHSLSEPETKYVNPQEQENAHVRALMQAIKADLLGSPGSRPKIAKPYNAPLEWRARRDLNPIGQVA